jgi:hypothetical protein
MLVPPELYGDLEAELACLPDERDTKNDKEIEEREKKEKEEREQRAREQIELERQRELKEREKEREIENAREREKQKEREREEKERERQKEKAREIRKGKEREQVEQGKQGIDKPRTDTGKGKKAATIQNETAETSVVIPKKRRRIQNKATVDDSDEYVDDQDESLPTNPAPVAKRVKLPDDNPPTNPTPVAKRTPVDATLIHETWYHAHKVYICIPETAHHPKCSHIPMAAGYTGGIYMRAG